ncbi:flagellar hook-basal body complex protein FliE [Oceanospirillum sp. HFRX-1_2]
MQSEIHQASRVAPSVKPAAESDGVKAADAPDFSEMLKAAIDKVNETQKTASALRESYEMGDPEVDITQVMIASQKSTVAFEAMSQVRNKLVSAYQEIMRMPV